MGVFMLIYQIFLRRTTFFHFNRIYLLAGLALSFILPCIRYTYDVHIPYELLANIVTNTQTVAEESVSSGNTFNVWRIIGGVYFVIVGIMLFRAIRSMLKIKKMTNARKSYSGENYVLIDSEKIKSPFSVFNYILFDSKKLSPTETDLIIKHELSHIRQKHWIDLLIGQIVLIVQCFNPLAWKYISLQKENHEYLADKAVIDEGISPTLYRAVLINQRFGGPVFAFSSAFNMSNPLNRLTMITKAKSSPWKKITVLIIIPLMGAYIWASAKPNYVIDMDSSPELHAPLNNEIKADSDEDSIRVQVQVVFDTVYTNNDNTQIQVQKSVTKTFSNIPDSISLYIKQIPERTVSMLYFEDGKVQADSLILLNPSNAKAFKVFGNANMLTDSVKGRLQPLLRGNIVQVNFRDSLNMLNPTDLSKNSVSFSFNSASEDSAFISRIKNISHLDSALVGKIRNISVRKDYQFNLENADSLLTANNRMKNLLVKITSADSLSIIPAKNAYTYSYKISSRNNTGDINISSNSSDLFDTLWIIDGKEVSTKDFQHMDKDDIKNISVLKNKEAIKRYGEKAKNGVIVVETKKK